ncbi:uncharacterized protein LOC118743736 [Rhagoletis pomonella]|uniref:uncharacterized protein LOC118743736 n=1 Tax=Rhagoletis pomonella TaxID=28610 RepID=UPI00178155BF|nr:uncharacterized protein LOC118743736 [Rhagoletis pomonella]
MVDFRMSTSRTKSAPEYPFNVVEDPEYSIALSIVPFKYRRIPLAAETCSGFGLSINRLTSPTADEMSGLVTIATNISDPINLPSNNIYKSSKRNALGLPASERSLFASKREITDTCITSPLTLSFTAYID